MNHNPGYRQQVALQRRQQTRPPDYQTDYQSDYGGGDYQGDYQDGSEGDYQDDYSEDYYQGYPAGGHRNRQTVRLGHQDRNSVNFGPGFTNSFFDSVGIQKGFFDENRNFFEENFPGASGGRRPWKYGQRGGQLNGLQYNRLNSGGRPNAGLQQHFQQAVRLPNLGGGNPSLDYGKLLALGHSDV